VEPFRKSGFIFKTCLALPNEVTEEQDQSQCEPCEKINDGFHLLKVGSSERVVKTAAVQNLIWVSLLKFGGSSEFPVLLILVQL